MSELLDIIISAVDNASEVFDEIRGSAEDAAETIEDTFDGSDMEGMTAALQEAEAEVEALTEELAGIYMGDIEGDAEAVEAKLAAAQEEAARLKEEIDNTGDSTSEASGEMEGLAGIISGIAGVEVFSQLSNELMSLADAAGNYNDSMMRASLEAEGAGISADQMKQSVSELSDETGRAGGQIRESFINATARGVTDMNSFKTMMEGAGAQATLFGTDIESMGNKFSQMAMRSTLMERSLAQTGITIDELGVAMGMSGATADEVKEKWKELDTNQKAAILGQAASMNEGEKANEAYKNSWAGLHEQLDIARGKLERMVGQVLLPVIIPAMQVAANVLDWLGGVLDSVMSGPFSGFVSVIGSVAAAIALAIPAYMALSAAFTFLTGPAFAAASALWAVMVPLLPWIAIGAAVALVIYEIGKAFGWWTDVGSMIDAIGAGLQRMWNAFINHPDVQAAIAAISAAFQWLVGAIGNAWQAVLKFFNINSSNKFDAVRALIDGLGNVWESFKFRVMLVFNVLQSLWNLFQAGYNAMLPVGEWLTSTFGPVWSWIGETINQILPYVTGLSNAFTAFQNGQLSLPGLVMTVLSTLWNVYVTVLSRISSAVLSWASGIVSNGISGAQRFVMGIVNRIMQLPIRFLQYLNQTRMRILSQMTAWVTLARSKISQFISGIMSKLGTLSGRVGAVLGAIVSVISTTIQSWVTAAKNKAQELVNGVRDALSGTSDAVSGALGGVVDAVVAPFRNAYNTAKEYWDKIKNLASSLPGAQGGESAMGGETIADIAGNNFNINTGEYTNATQEIDINHNIVLDLRNVPAQIDTATLISMLSDPTVLKALTGNPDFQSLDARVKERLNLKQVRSRGR